MNLFFDTSVLIAASVAEHPRHGRAFAALDQIRRGEHKGWISQHTIAEFYAVLTAAPVTPRIHPSEALRILEENLLPHFQVIALEPVDYAEVVREMASGGWRSGRVYDALHMRCARKQPIDRVYTYNGKDYRACAPEDWKDRIGEP